MTRKPTALVISGRNVNWHDLAPEFAARLLAACEAVGWLVSWLSAVRTYAQQKYLYLGWVRGKPGFNLAANPDRTRPDGTKGSKHQAQWGFGYAVDLRRRPGCPEWGSIHSTFKPFGLHFPVRVPVREDWHVTAYERFENGQPVWLPVSPAREAAVQRWRDWLAKTAPTKTGWAAVAAFIADARKTVLRPGDKGPVVKLAQTKLNAADTHVEGQPARWATLTVDGHYGPMTEAVVKEFQKREHLDADGLVGPMTWGALLDG